MSETKRAEPTPTKGPYTVSQQKGLRLFIVAQDEAIAEVLQGELFNAELFATANLLAASWELLQALTRGHLHFLQNNNLTADDREMLDEMWAAIARARGKE